jgi:hypothetical protein
MARVTIDDTTSTPQTSTQTTKSSIQGDTYYYRTGVPTNTVDPRLKNNQLAQLINNFSNSAQIYSNKPGCWQDYFKRSTLTVYYRNNWDNPIPKTLTGYQLAMQMLTGSQSNQDGSYFDPECFCIIPVDIVGQIMPVQGELIVQQGSPASYYYDETHEYIIIDPSGEFVYQPHQSAVANNRDYELSTQMSDPLTIPRYADWVYSTPAFQQKGQPSSDQFADIKKPCMWFPIVMKDPTHTYPYDVPLTTTDYWIVKPAGYTLLEPSNKVVANMVLQFLCPDSPNTLCGVGFCWILLGYYDDVVMMTLIHTDGDPTWDLWWGNEKVVSISIGTGNFIVETLTFQPSSIANYDPGSMSFNSSLDPMPIGRHPGNPIYGLVTPVQLKGMDLPPSPLDPAACDCWFNFPAFYFETDEPISFHAANPSPNIMLTLKKIEYNDWGFQCWWPYGVIDMYASADGIEYGIVATTGHAVYVNPAQSVYCFTNWTATGDFKYFKFVIHTTTAWTNATGTLIGDPRVPGVGCCNLPNIGETCLWFLEYDKPGDLDWE